MTDLHRSYLYVAGHDEKRIAKAYETDADCVVLDLEDAVPDSRKAEARATVAEVLKRQPAKPTQVRLGPAWRLDLPVVGSPWVQTVRIPKCESPELIREIGDALSERGSAARIVALIESARGVEEAASLATAHGRVAGIMLGEADLSADLGVTSDDGLLYARLRIVAAARAAGLPGPVQSVYVDVADVEGLRRSSAWGRSVGFTGRSAVHPRQIEPINAAYTPTGAEVARAREIVDVFEASLRRGAAAALTTDGRFVDPATVASARSVLRHAGKDSR
jgi:citrate lyase subunit beta/citryl-CoA lyase